MEDTPYVYEKPVIEFVTVATEYCRLLESEEATTAEAFARVMRPLLPLLYLKMTLLPPPPEVEGYADDVVTEGDYDRIRTRIAATLGAADDYLDTFQEDFKYSEAPVLRTISEDLADVYQPLRNLVEAYRRGYDEAMLAALGECHEQFRLFWGGCALGALRALHAAFASE